MVNFQEKANFIWQVTDDILGASFTFLRRIHISL